MVLIDHECLYFRINLLPWKQRLGCSQTILMKLYLKKKKKKTLKLFLKKTKQSIQQVSLRGPGFFMVGVVVSSQEGAVLQKENRCHMMYSVN